MVRVGDICFRLSLILGRAAALMCGLFAVPCEQHSDFRFPYFPRPAVHLHLLFSTVFQSDQTSLQRRSAKSATLSDFSTLLFPVFTECHSLYWLDLVVPLTFSILSITVVSLIVHEFECRLSVCSPNLCVLVAESLVCMLLLVCPASRRLYQSGMTPDINCRILCRRFVGLLFVFPFLSVPLPNQSDTTPEATLTSVTFEETYIVHGVFVTYRAWRICSVVERIVELLYSF